MESEESGESEKVREGGGRRKGEGMFTTIPLPAAGCAVA